ncbi:MAG: phosphoenolpyruvate-utilizing protein [Acidimicrobiaceae bacterium]|nr:phosphoenolpyruvate-utilizing protein [Acidimicrobiaceae bacterium]
MTERYYVTDSDLSEQYTLYTRANVGEVFPDPVTPLTSSTGLYQAELGWRDAWERMGAFTHEEFPQDTFAQLGVVGGYCYLNASLIRLFGVRAPGLTWEDMDEQFFGAMPGVPPYKQRSGDEDIEKTQKIAATFQWALSHTKLQDLEELTESRIATKKLRDDRPDFSEYANEELFDQYCDLLKLHRKYFSQHIFTTYMATVPVGIISGVANAVGRPDLLLPIIAGFGEVDSAEPSHAMWDMGRMVRSNDQLTTEFDKGIEGLMDRLARSDEAEADEFLNAFEHFVYEYGSRGPNEWETRSPSWETKPELALNAIDRMRLAGDEFAPKTQNSERASQRQQAATELLSMVESDPAVHGELAVGIAASAAWLPARERTKTNNIRLIHEMRMIMRAIGGRIVEENGFDEIEDFGFVTDEEYGRLFKEPTSMLETIRSRREEYYKLLEREAQFLFDGQADHPETWRRRDAVSEDVLVKDEMLQGMPGCTGLAEGTARVILDSNDPTSLQPGDILVAPLTDPSWTPLFVPAAAVVVDVGAPLSHAIIVSRELGIPCVVSATDATRRIPNGARIEVNGDTGVITILEV